MVLRTRIFSQAERSVHVCVEVRVKASFSLGKEEDACMWEVRVKVSFETWFLYITQAGFDPSITAVCCHLGRPFIQSH
jgi:hypothetical protein